MKRLLKKLLPAAFILAGLTVSSAEILLLGSPLERSVIREKILRPNGIRHNDSADWVAPGDFGKYAAVLLVDRDKSSGKWSAKSDIDALRKYLQNGGTVILGGHAIMDLGGARRSLKSLEKLDLKIGWIETLIL